MKKLLKTAEWKIRAKYINPFVGILQYKIGEKIKYFVNCNNIKNTYDLNYLFDDKSVAIIGNSPIIENSGYGELIDSYDIVVRFNKGILDSKLDSNDTGKRTDIWCSGALDTLTSFSVKSQIEKTGKKVSILVPFPFNASEYKNNGFNVFTLELMNPYKKQKKFYIDYEMFLKLGKSLGKEPSSGFTAINYVLNSTKASYIGLFGFSFSSNNRISGNSYATQHDFDKERYIIEEMVNNNPSRLSLFT